MKKLRLCFEIEDMGMDADGNLLPAGGCMTIGDENSEEVTEEEYKKIAKTLSIEGLLKVLCLDGIISPEKVKIITPAEYDEKYGDDED